MCLSTVCLSVCPDCLACLHIRSCICVCMWMPYPSVCLSVVLSLSLYFSMSGRYTMCIYPSTPLTCRSTYACMHVCIYPSIYASTSLHFYVRAYLDGGAGTNLEWAVAQAHLARTEVCHSLPVRQNLRCSCCSARLKTM